MQVWGRLPAVLGAVGIMACTLAVMPQLASAGAPAVLAVSASSGSDASDCSVAAPCATVQRAIDAAGTADSTIVVESGTYAGALTVAAEQHITLVPRSTDAVELSAPSGAQALPVITNHGTLSISGVRLSGGSAGIVQDRGSLSVGALVADSRANGVRIEGGSAFVTGPLSNSDAIYVALELDAGSLLVKDARLFAPITQTGGRLVLDDVTSYAVLNPVTVTGGTALIEDSWIDSATRDTPAVAVTGDSDVTVAHSSFLGERAPVADGPDATLTLISSTISEPSQPLTATNGATVRLAATVLDYGVDIAACRGSIVDGGFNSSYDNSCGFTAGSSENSAAQNLVRFAVNPDVDLDGFYGSGVLAPMNGPVGRNPDGSAIPNMLIDAIPVHSSALFDPNIDLCDPATTRDQTGASAAVGGRCDLGAIELRASSVDLTASRAAAVSGQTLTLTAHVVADVSAVRLLDGGLTITDAGQPIGACTNLPVYVSDTVTCTITPTPGAHSYSAVYTPSGDIHPATRTTATVQISKAPTAIALTVPSVAYGHASMLVAHVTNAATHTPAVVTAQLYVRDASTAWRPLGRPRTSSAAGVFSEKVVPTRSADYQLRSAASSRTLAATSAAVHCVVTPAFASLHVSDSTVRRNSTTRVYGTLSPMARGLTAHLQTLTHGRWTTAPFHAVTRLQRQPDGRTAVSFVIPVRLPHPATYTLRVFVPATSDYGSSVSQSLTVHVS